MNNIPLLIQGTGLVLVTLLIPIWISLFINEEKQFEKLDEKVLVNYILGGKDILYSLGLIFIPTILWQLEYFGIRPLIIVSSGIGIFFLFRNVSRALIWISGGKTHIRLDFLNSLKEFENTEEIWHSVWKIKNIDKEKEYLDIFFEKLESLIKNKEGEDLNVLSYYLRDFKENLENRDVRNILFEDYFSKLLDWYHDSWIGLEDLRHRDNDKDHDWELEKNFIIKGQSEEIFEKNWKILIERGALYNFTKRTFKNKIDEWRDNRSLLKDILGNFLNVLFEETKDKNNYRIWDLNFPKEWKITRENWLGRDIILEIIFEEYYVWAFNRFPEVSDKVDEELSNVTKKLFPDVDYYIWVKILIFRFTIDDNLREKLKFMIVRKWSFRMLMMAKVSFASQAGESKNIKEFKKEEENAFDLAFELFRDDFSEEMLKEYISILEDLKGEFEKDSIYENRRKGILEMFEAMSEYKSKKK